MHSDRDMAARGVVGLQPAALVSGETLGQWMSSSFFGSSNSNYAQACITYMSPADYLCLTTIYDSARIRREAQGLNRACSILALGLHNPKSIYIIREPFT